MVAEALSTQEAVAQLQRLAQVKAARSVQLRTVVLAAAGAWAFGQLALVSWLRLWGRELALSVLAGVAWGVLLAGVYQWNRKRKAERGQRVSGSTPVP